MDIRNIQYFNDQVEGNLKAFYCDGMIGIQNLKSGKRTIPCFDHIITSPNYVFVEVNESWGVLDKDLCLIIPPKYQVIYPVKEIDRETYANACLLKKFDSSFTFNADVNRPTHIAIQTAEADVEHPKFMASDAFIYDCLYGSFKEDDRADFYEIIYDYEHLEASPFVLVSKDGRPRLIDINNETHNGRKNDFFFLWHYKENTFMHQDFKCCFGFCTYRSGRLFRETFICPQQGDCNIVSSPNIRFHENDYVSVCLPDIIKHVGNIIYSNEKLNISGKWALFRYNHRKTGFAWEEKEESYFQQLTPFAFTEPLSPTHNGFSFICREMGKEWLVRYNSNKESMKSILHITDEDSEKAAALVDEYMHSTYKQDLLESFVDICFKGVLEIESPFFDSIEPREDGLFDISTDEGYGLCDEKMKVLVPTKYDTPIEGFDKLMIVSKKGKYGVINGNAEEIVPCVYTSVKIGTDKIEVWNYSSEYDDFSGDWKSHNYIGNQCDIPINYDEKKEELFIVGINTEIKEGQGVFSTLRLIPNYYSGNKVFGSLCDIYLPTGEMITHFSRIPKGGIEYSKEYGLVKSYERITYSQDNDEFLEGITLFFLKGQKTTPQYAQIMMLNQSAFLAFDYAHVGIVSNVSDGKTNFPWVVPAIYFKISIPINNIIYAWKWKDDKKYIDIYDLSDNYKLILSVESITNISLIIKENCIDEQMVRLIKLDDINNIKYFPYEVYYKSDTSDSCFENSYENDLRDAFEDDPEAMWGREW